MLRQSGSVAEPLRVVLTDADGTPYVASGSVIPDPLPISGTVTVIQSTAANLNATVVGTGTFAAQVTGSVTVTQATGTNLHTVVDSGSITAVQPTGTNLHVVVDSGAITPTVPVAATETLSNVSSSASNVTLLAANSARRGAVFYNDSTQACYLKFGATATSSSFTYKVFPSQTIELPQPIYTGIIDGIWVSANGAMRVTEAT